MNNEISSLFGGSTTAAGSRLSAGIARQTRKEVDLVSARTEVAVFTDQARAFLASGTMSNIGNLVGQAEQLMQIAPAGAQYYELIINAYGMGAANGIARLH
jgi:hypothetical protein